jgi:hypothetical protein
VACPPACKSPRVLRREYAVPAVAQMPSITFKGIVLDGNIDEYLSGKPCATLLGKLVALVLPPPVRFLASWVAPLACLIALNAQVVVARIVMVLAVAQVRSSVGTGLLPWLAHQSLSLPQGGSKRYEAVIRDLPSTVV